MSLKRSLDEAGLNEGKDDDLLSNGHDAKRMKMGHHEMGDKIISLQIGERRFTTRISTLTKDENAYFASLFSGKYSTETSLNEAIFIDRDGDLFQYILSYLRSGSLIVSQKENPDQILFHKLLIEAQFYMIEPLEKYLQNILTGKTKSNLLLPDSEILTTEEQEKMIDMLEDYELLEEDGTSNWVLHRAESMWMSGIITCEVPTIILIEDIAGNVFGVKSREGIARFKSLFPNGYENHSQHIEDNGFCAVYFNVRDASNKLSPFQCIAQCNEVLGNYRIDDNDIDCCFGCAVRTNKKFIKNTSTTWLQVPSNLKTAGRRAIEEGQDEEKLVYSSFITKRIEMFVLHCAAPIRLT